VAAQPGQCPAHGGVPAAQGAGDLPEAGGGLELTGNKRKQLWSLGVIGGRESLPGVGALAGQAAIARDPVGGTRTRVVPVAMEPVARGARPRGVLGALLPGTVGGHEISGGNLLDGAPWHVHAGPWKANGGPGSEPRNGHLFLADGRPRPRCGPPASAWNKTRQPRQRESLNGSQHARIHHASRSTRERAAAGTPAPAGRGRPRSPRGPPAAAASGRRRAWQERGRPRPGRRRACSPSG
jgi:hypothetical protein